MNAYTPTRTEAKRISELVRHYVENQAHFTLVLSQLNDHVLGDRDLMTQIHSVKWRVKDPNHLRDKLVRKLKEAKEEHKPFNITKDNLFLKINDLAGFRILHLHTRQMDQINKMLLKRFDEALYRLVEGPVAKTWDDESRKYFEGVGIRIEKSKKAKKKKESSLYTSVHYVIRPNLKTKSTCEIQVRTLADEVWGEVDHAINYPYHVNSVACHEQIQVLARVTTSCSRLVDSIFKSFEESRQRIRPARKRHSREQRRPNR
jgi:putative GTP pyrophosphokinase